MAKVYFVSASGSEQSVEANEGSSLMQVALDHGIGGIVGECGGGCSCATCHVYVDADWFDRLGPASEIEQGLLDFAIEPRPTSRLSCQIRISDSLDGLRVTMPESQY